MCSNRVLCAGPTETGDQLATCYVQIQQQTSCNLAIGVGPTYDACLQGLRTLSCDAADVPAAVTAACDTGVVYYGDM